jgi:hypothetical protein
MTADMNKKDKDDVLYTILTGTGTNIPQISSINKNLDFYDDVSKAISIISNSAPFSVTQQYPITNAHYTQFVMKSQLPNDLRIFVNNDVAIDRYFTEACLMDGENFVANLLNIRKGVTATYDPWYRSISTHQHSTYPELSVGKGSYGNYYGMQQFQIKFGPNYEEILLVWALRSTISGNPINIFLYSFAKFEYINKRKTEKHLKSIHPYMVNTSDSYDLLR